jgi:hypothetical protein
VREARDRKARPRARTRTVVAQDERG